MGCRGLPVKKSAPPADGDERPFVSFVGPPADGDNNRSSVLPSSVLEKPKWVHTLEWKLAGGSLICFSLFVFSAILASVLLLLLTRLLHRPLLTPTLPSFTGLVPPQTGQERLSTDGDNGVNP